MQQKDHPFYRIGAGAFLAFVAFVAAIFTIITDESLIRGGNGNVSLSWEVAQQPWDLINGQYSGREAWAIIGAWMIFSAYIMLSVIEHFHTDKVLKSVVWILVTIDGIANFLYFRGLPVVYQCLLSGLVFFSLVYGGRKGVFLFCSGFNEIHTMRRGRDE
jgi:hypothetical protein